MQNNKSVLQTTVNWLYVHRRQKTLEADVRRIGLKGFTLEVECYIRDIILRRDTRLTSTFLATDVSSSQS